VKLWVAQGFGVGRIPFAPGTFGSVVGLAWCALLLASAHVWFLVVGTALGLAASVWLCGAAEKALGRKDPGSVVLDEVAAMPVCFVSWIGLYFFHNGTLPLPSYFVSKRNWLFALGVFAGFRLFDIWKPWPVRQSQSLPGGWGVTVDDVLAALYVALLMLPIQLWRIR
jgi:phosphatidylglycerophosphatase A